MTTLCRPDSALVRGVVRRLQRRLPAAWDWEALEQVGRIALWRSEREFDPDRGMAWAPFAQVRIRQAILDEVRVTLGRYLQRPSANSEELSGELPGREAAPDALAIEHDERARLQAGLDRLGTRQRFVLRRRMAGWSLSDIGSLLGVSFSAVWHMERHARLDLAAALAKPMFRPVELELPAPAAPPRRLRDLTRLVIEERLRAFGGDVTAAAESLDIGRATIYRRLEEWGTTVESYR